MITALLPAANRVRPLVWIITSSSVMCVAIGDRLRIRRLADHPDLAIERPHEIVYHDGYVRITDIFLKPLGQLR